MKWRQGRSIVSSVCVVCVVCVMALMVASSVSGQNAGPDRSGGRADIDTLVESLQRLLHFRERLDDWVSAIEDSHQRLDDRVSAIEDVARGYGGRFFNVDALMVLEINGARVLSCARADVECFLGTDRFAEYLTGEENHVRVILGNGAGPYAFGYEIRKGGVLQFAGRCGVAVADRSGLGTPVSCMRFEDLHSEVPVLEFVTDGSGNVVRGGSLS